MNSYKTRISPSAEPQQFQIFVELWHFTFQLCERHKGSDPGQGIPSLLSWAPEPEATLFPLKYLCYVGSFLILRTENLNIWREKMELNWLAHKEVPSPMEAFGAEELIFLFKLSLFQGEVLKLQITLQTLENTTLHSDTTD